MERRDGGLEGRGPRQNLSSPLFLLVLTSVPFILPFLLEMARLPACPAVVDLPFVAARLQAAHRLQVSGWLALDALWLRPLRKCARSHGKH